jgi:hypothetical protein
VHHCYNKQILRKSTKETGKRKAEDFAKCFVEEIVVGNWASLMAQLSNGS